MEYAAIKLSQQIIFLIIETSKRTKIYQWDWNSTKIKPVS